MKKRVDIIWNPEHKAKVLAYVQAKGLDFSDFVNLVLQKRIEDHRKKNKTESLRSTSKPSYRRKNPGRNK